MRGSLENPPIILRESWLSWGGSLFLGVVCLSASLYLPLAGEGPNPGHGWYGVIASGVFLVWRYFHPARVEIWPDRFMWVGLLPIRHEYAFRDIDEFGLNYASKGDVCVAFKLKKDSPRRKRLDAVSELLTGFDETISGSWEISSQQFCDLLNRTRILPSAWH
jgi:hypothetical protein